MMQFGSFVYLFTRLLNSQKAIIIIIIIIIIISSSTSSSDVPVVMTDNITVTCRHISRKQVGRHVLCGATILGNKSSLGVKRFLGYDRSTNISLDTGTLYKRPFR
jgi:hypothetical protein